MPMGKKFAMYVNELQLKNAPQEIHSRVTRSLVLRVLMPLKSFPKEKAKLLLQDLSNIADHYLRNRYGVMLTLNSKESVRKARKALGESIRKLQANERSLCENYANVKQVVGPILKKDAFSFRPAFRELLILERELKLLEITCAATVHPKFWPESRGEQRLAEQFPRKLHHVQYPVTEGSKKLRDNVARLLHGQIREFTGGDKRAQVREFIREFFAAFDEPIERNALKMVLKKPRSRPPD